MGDEFEKIEKTGSEFYDWYKGILLKERLLYGEMVELLLESVRPLARYHKKTAHDELALLTLTSRLFNDAEGARYLLLHGLPSQADIVIRDIIECSMLFRLFLRHPQLAKRWLMESKEYQPGDVDAKLSEMGILAREYAFYGPLSHEGHANLLGSLSNIQEEVVGEGIRHTFHFGSARNPETIYFVHQGFITLFFLLYLSLIEPMAEFYSEHSETNVLSLWAEKVNALFPKLETLAAELDTKEGKKKAPVDRHIYELVMKKMRVKEFRAKLLGN